ncbi:hypothetical protein DSUL_20145 [Desulfovibrionales bacterium]
MAHIVWVYLVQVMGTTSVEGGDCFGMYEVLFQVSNKIY